MATIDIPSLPSTDLNNMVSLFLKPPPGKQTRSLWPGATTVTVVEDCGETDRSPEPRTPKFGVTSTPTFEESNAHFGFQFPRSSDSSNMAAVSSRVTNVSVFVSEADSNTAASRQPHHEVMESEATVEEEPAQYVIVQEDNLDSQLNIPTTVLDEVRESSSSDKMSGKVKRSDLPTIMLASGDGKPASFIRFLNDPIPLPVQYEHQELNIDKYRKPVEDSFETVPSGAVHQRLIADLDAIQRMEQDPVYPETKYIHFTPDECVPPADQTSGSEQYTYTDSTSSEDSSSNSAPVYHHDPDAMISEVAAYQCVDETPTYTELTTRPLSPTPGICQQQPDDLLTYSQSSGRQTGNQTQGFSDSYLDEDESQQRSSAKWNTSGKLSLMNELKNKIQLKRLKEGKGELKVSFENRPIGEPSEEEKIKAEVRRQKNRESAVKSRERRQKLLEHLEKEVKALERENKQLVRDIGKLREANIKLSNFDCDCFNTVTNPEYPTTDVAIDHGEDAGSQDFQKALSEFLARQDNT